MKAFPVGNSERVWEEGMDLRDYFAAKALQGLLNDSNMNSSYFNNVGTAKLSYELADAMMKAREK